MLWLRPWMRVRCFSGTISVVDAVMAGEWNAAPSARRKSSARTCGMSAIPAAKSQASKSDAAATNPSAASITVLRFQRSISAPITGPSTIGGSRPSSVAVARMVADPLVSVSHQISANWTAWLPTRESDWPVQRMKKGRMGRSGEGSASIVESAFVRVWVMSYLLAFPAHTRHS